MYFPTLLNEINISPAALRLYVELNFQGGRNMKTLAMDCFALDTPDDPTGDKAVKLLLGAMNELRDRRMMLATGNKPLGATFWDITPLTRTPITHPRAPGYMDCDTQPKDLHLSTPAFRLLFWMLSQPMDDMTFKIAPGTDFHLTDAQIEQAMNELRGRKLLPQLDDEAALNE